MKVRDAPPFLGQNENRGLRQRSPLHLQSLFRGAVGGLDTESGQHDGALLGVIHTGILLVERHPRSQTGSKLQKGLTPGPGRFRIPHQIIHQERLAIQEGQSEGKIADRYGLSERPDRGRGAGTWEFHPRLRPVQDQRIAFGRWQVLTIPPVLEGAAYQESDQEKPRGEKSWTQEPHATTDG